MVPHVNSVCKSAFFHLHNISRIRNFLPRSALIQLVHAFVTSRLDYGNALLYGCPETLIQKLQLVQNAAARLV